MPSERPLLLRPGTPDDLAGVGEVLLAARAAAVPAMPPLPHPPRDTRAAVERWDLHRHELWVATGDRGEVLGFALLTGAWLDHLYVAPGAQRTGVGTALLEVAQAVRPAGFCLWAFEANAPARAFYARHGLVELERTDGTANDEGVPDVRLAWPGTDPGRFLRGLLDEVDRELADVLARRAAISRALGEEAPEHAGVSAADARIDPRGRVG